MDLKDKLFIEYNYDRILKEKKYYDKKEGNLKGATAFNFIVKYYQQNVFFRKENELYNDPKIKERLIKNRCKYLNKTEDQLTTNDLLLGFKRSGIHYGYSHFNPLIFKYFIERYDIKKCYDPCGGWGHRLLVTSRLDLYVYNDLSKTTYENCKRISKELGMTNTMLFNNDAKEFIPNVEIDSMFTCPPYYNLEEYECGSFKDKNEYNAFIDSLFDVFEKSTAKIFGLVIREDLLEERHKKQYYESFVIENKKSKHLTNDIVHHKTEVLYIFRK